MISAPPIYLLQLGRSLHPSPFTGASFFFFIHFSLLTVNLLLYLFTLESRVLAHGSTAPLGILWLVWVLCRYNSRKFSIVRLPFVCARSSDVRDRQPPRTHIRLRLYIYDHFRAQDSMPVGSFPVLAASCTLSIQDSAHSQRRSHSPPKRSLISR